MQAGDEPGRQTLEGRDAEEPKDGKLQHIGGCSFNGAALEADIYPYIHFTVSLSNLRGFTVSPVHGCSTNIYHKALRSTCTVKPWGDCTKVLHLLGML